MSRLEETYQELQEAKKQRRELTKMFKDELKHNQEYQRITEEMKKLREEKKAVENTVKASALKDAQALDDLRVEITSLQELLSDIALNMYVSKKTVEIVDEKDGRYVPHFSVRFKKD